MQLQRSNTLVPDDPGPIFEARVLRNENDSTNRTTHCRTAQDGPLRPRSCEWHSCCGAIELLKPTQGVWYLVFRRQIIGNGIDSMTQPSATLRCLPDACYASCKYATCATTKTQGRELKRGKKHSQRGKRSLTRPLPASCVIRRRRAGM